MVAGRACPRAGPAPARRARVAHAGAAHGRGAWRSSRARATTITSLGTLAPDAGPSEIAVMKKLIAPEGGGRRRPGAVAHVARRRGRAHDPDPQGRERRDRARAAKPDGADRSLVARRYALRLPHRRRQRRRARPARHPHRRHDPEHAGGRAPARRELGFKALCRRLRARCRCRRGIDRASIARARSREANGAHAADGHCVSSSPSAC